MGLIPEDIIADIRDRADLVAIIGRHVQLKKSGRSFKGLCPFHGEKTPSFHVHPDRGFYYCFGCQAKGDVFSFLKEYEGKSFIEAAESLASELGITIPEQALRGGEPRSRRRELLDINRVATDFFIERLEGPAGADARAYLEGRGIGTEIAAEFQLGYAPNDWGELADHLRRLGQSADIAEAVGLVVPKKSGQGYYDRFRDRLMCPIILPGGEVAGFSGRLVHDTGDKAGAKYINSPESSVYKKSKLLFGLQLARAGFRDKDRAVLVEGNFDVVTLHQAGLKETVAPLGTALTTEQVDQLRRLTDRVVLFYDGDRAGRMAAYKALKALIAVDLEVAIAVLPEGEDPDSAARERGSEYLHQLVDSAQPAVEYFIYDVWAKGGGSAQRQARALEAAVALIQALKNPLKQNLIAGKLASALGISPGDVQRAVRGGQARSQPEDRRPEPAQLREMPPRHELDVLSVLADHPQLLETAEERDVFSHLTDERVRDMYSAQRSGEHMLSALPDDGSDPMVAQIAKYVFAGSYSEVKDPAHTLSETVASLLQVRKRARLELLQKQADEAGRRGDVERQRQLVREIVETRRQVD
ncbi:MAG: DNA primase [Deltaproteobacteria bacterium]|nr:DNA primase [Deltaproteobacteria bacterium]